MSDCDHYTIDDALALLGYKPEGPVISFTTEVDTDKYFIKTGQWELPKPPCGRVWHDPFVEGVSWHAALNSTDCTGWRPMMLDEKIHKGDEFFGDGKWRRVAPYGTAVPLTKTHRPFRTKRPIEIVYTTPMITSHE